MSIEIGFYPLAGILIAGLLYGIYRLVLRMRVAPRTSQWFIIGSVVLSLALTFVVPVRMIDRPISRPLQPHPLTLSPEGERGAYGDIGSNNSESISTPATEKVTTQETVTTSFPTREGYGGGSAVGSAWLFVYCIGALLVLLHMLGQLVWLLWMKRRSAFVGEDRRMSIYETTFATPFSFGRNIFLPASLDSETHRYVLMHEQSHVRHSHFAVLCLMEVMVAAQWFNPFAWLLMNELKMQHEMEVDADMMRAGVERRAYQMSLLNIASNSGRWLLMQTAFGSSPLKFRILFMNRTLDAKNVRRRLWSGVAAAAALIIGFTFAACSLNPRVPKSPLDGTWTMEWIRNTDATWESYPFRKHIKFCANDWLMVVSYGAKDGHSIDFSFSGEQQAFRNDTIYNRIGKPAHYEFMDDGERHTVVWKKEPYMNAGVDGPSITEQWVRCERDADLDYVLQHLASADKQAHGWRFAGVWELLKNDDDPDAHDYIVLTDEMAYYLAYYERDHEGTYCAGSCTSMTLNRTSDTDFPFFNHTNAHIDHVATDSIDFTFTKEGHEPEQHTFVRTTLPQRFLYLLSSTL